MEHHWIEQVLRYSEELVQIEHLGELVQIHLLQILAPPQHEHPQSVLEDLREHHSQGLQVLHNQNHLIWV